MGALNLVLCHVAADNDARPKSGEKPVRDLPEAGTDSWRPIAAGPGRNALGRHTVHTTGSENPRLVAQRGVTMNCDIAVQQRTG